MRAPGRLLVVLTLGAVARAGAAPPAGRVEQVGEVAVVEGDQALVAADGGGGFSVRPDEASQHPPAIARRFYGAFSDEYDALVVATTFRDQGAPGVPAYYLAVRGDVAGLGVPLVDASAAWGATGGALHGYVHLKSLAAWAALDGRALSDPASRVYAVLGQELAHRWLARLVYLDDAGHVSRDLLGREGAHWASTLQADASLLDGRRWRDDGGGRFTVVAQEEKYADVDLYAMGLLPASAVGPLTLLRGAVRTSDGQAVDPADYDAVGPGTTVTATPETIDFARVTAALGPRTPAYEAAPKRFRVAFVLLTRPGERAADVGAEVADVDVVRRGWAAAFDRFTGGRGVMCTGLSAPCGGAVARVAAGRLERLAATGARGTTGPALEPGDRVAATFTLLDDAAEPATGVLVSVAAPSVTFDRPTLLVPLVPARGSVGVRFEGTLASATAAGGLGACGGSLEARAEAIAGGHRFRGFASAPVGVRELYREGFEAGPGGFSPNGDGSDTAREGGFAWGTPLRYADGSGYAFQPDGGAGGSSRALFTDPRRGDFWARDFHSLGVGRSSVWSPPIDLARALRPRLRYRAWLVALDVSSPPRAPAPVDEDRLVVEATADGRSFVEVDRVGGAEDAWRRRQVDLDAALPPSLRGRPVRLRFTVNRDRADELVEAGIDDVVVTSETLECHPEAPAPVDDAGAGCALAAPRPAPRDALAALALAAAVLLAAVATRRGLRR